MANTVDWLKSHWKEKMRPAAWPTWEEYQNALEMTKDPGGRFLHFGIAGTVKSGKSSIINSLRGLSPRDPRAAEIGASECTAVVTRYEDPRPNFPFAWYDIPGSGTASIPAESYFNSQGLFALDCVVVVVSNSFTAHDAQLVRQCAELCIPTYIVRSRSDTAIEDMRKDDPTLDVDQAKALYIREASENIARGLRDFKLEDQRCYLVNKWCMLRVVQGESEPQAEIHESELILDILRECGKRRMPGGWSL